MIDRTQTTCCARCNAAMYVGEGKQWLQVHCITDKKRKVIVCNTCFRTLAKCVLVTRGSTR